eukprot:PhM_4_TR13233/c0_g1_i1/m.36190/K07935/IFT22, RABL5; intraflagellar transport protein 22
MERVKVLVVGPSKVGKTCIVNYLSNHSDHPAQDYKETVASRVLDFELTVGSNRRSAKVLVELWDVSGNPKYQNCWPAIYYEAQGAIFLMNPEIRNQERELEFWHKSLVEKARIPDTCTLTFVHHSSPPTVTGPSCKPKQASMPKCLANSKIIETSLDFHSEPFRNEFEKLVEAILAHKKDEEEKKVLATMNNKMGSGPLQVQPSN